VAGIDQQALEAVLEHGPHGPPIHARGLHRDLRHFVRLKPVTQGEKALNRRPKLSHVLDTLAPLTWQAHTRHHGRVVHIKRPGALHDHIHPTAPFGSIDTDRPLARSLDS
jgi:hypothetical protein